MPELLRAPFSNDLAVAPAEVASRLALALLFGWLVAWIYRGTRARMDYAESFPQTLVLLSVLIAMVLQVIGDSVARAFSLVGALSVVRFRTVVRDTKDTAFVIFAVVVGMATGASDARVALVGLLIVGLAAFAMKDRSSVRGRETDQFDVKVRLFAGTDVERAIGPPLDASASSRRLAEISTAKQRSAIDVRYVISFRPARGPAELTSELSRVETVQSVEIAARPDRSDDE